MESRLWGLIWLLLPRCISPLVGVVRWSTYLLKYERFCSGASGPLSICCLCNHYRLPGIQCHSGSLPYNLVNETGGIPNGPAAPGLWPRCAAGPFRFGNYSI